MRIEEVLETANLDAQMLLQVHYELIFELPEDQVDETQKLVITTMEKQQNPPSSLKVEAAANWVLSSANSVNSSEPNFSF